MHPSVQRKFTSLLLVSCLLVLMGGPLSADDSGDLSEGRVYAIQDRDFRMSQEFSVGLAFLPLDAFYKYFALSGHYVLHFNDLWAWEAIHVSFSKFMDINTGLEAQMSSDWDVSATDTEKIDYFIDTNLMIKPMYGKVALFNKWVVYLESYFLLGVGAEKFQTAWFPAVDVGAGMRIFLTNTLSLRFEAREYIYIEEGGVDSTLFLGFGFSYNAFAEDRFIDRDSQRVGVRQ